MSDSERAYNVIRTYETSALKAEVRLYSDRVTVWWTDGPRTGEEVVSSYSEALRQLKELHTEEPGIKDDTTKRAIAVGNVADGHTFYGPFDNAEEALEWANHVNDEWWLVDLERPYA